MSKLETSRVVEPEVFEKISKYNMMEFYLEDLIKLAKGEKEVGEFLTSAELKNFVRWQIFERPYRSRYFLTQEALNILKGMAEARNIELEVSSKRQQIYQQKPSNANPRCPVCDSTSKCLKLYTRKDGSMVIRYRCTNKECKKFFSI